MKLAVVILNWNGADLLEQYLPSVIKYSPDAHIYVADNGSEDNSRELVRKKFPEVRLIENPTNEGFAGGYNSALKHVEADIFCLLNSDVEVTEGWIKPIYDVFSTYPKAAIVQPKIKDLREPEYFEYAGAAGGFIDMLGYPYCRGRIFQSLEQDHGQYDDICEIFWATGACMFIKADVFRNLGGFDPDYFAHQEEIDLCWRAHNARHKVYYTGLSTVYHLGGSTLSNMSPKKTYLNFRNSLFSIAKNLPRRKAVLIVLSRLVLDLVAGIRFIIQFNLNHFFAIIRAHLSFHRQLRTIMKKREKMRTIKKYYHTKSIVWSYYVLQIRRFSDLVKD